MHYKNMICGHSRILYITSVYCECFIQKYIKKRIHDCVKIIMHVYMYNRNYNSYLIFHDLFQTNLFVTIKVNLECKTFNVVKIFIREINMFYEKYISQQYDYMGI